MKKHADWRWRDVASVALICTLILAVGRHLLKEAQPPIPDPVTEEMFQNDIFAAQEEHLIRVQPYIETNNHEGMLEEARRLDAKLFEVFTKHQRPCPEWLSKRMAER